MCELQVLDDTTTKYAKLDPRQDHGSAYGMVPAKRGYLRPVGEWNFQEVTVKGPKIKVELNGTVILDADLSKVNEFMANSPHPGKDRTSGYLRLRRPQRPGRVPQHRDQAAELNLRAIERAGRSTMHVKCRARSGPRPASFARPCDLSTDHEDVERRYTRIGRRYRMKGVCRGLTRGLITGRRIRFRSRGRGFRRDATFLATLGSSGAGGVDPHGGFGTRRGGFALAANFSVNSCRLRG